MGYIYRREEKSGWGVRKRNYRVCERGCVLKEMRERETETGGKEREQEKEDKLKETKTRILYIEERKYTPEPSEQAGRGTTKKALEHSISRSS